MGRAVFMTKYLSVVWISELFKIRLIQEVTGILWVLLGTL